MNQVPVHRPGIQHVLGFTVAQGASIFEKAESDGHDCHPTNQYQYMSSITSAASRPPANPARPATPALMPPLVPALYPLYPWAGAPESGFKASENHL